MKIVPQTPPIARPRAATVLLALMCAAAIVSGCSMFGYTVGSSLPKNLRRIHVATFENASGEPQLEAECTAAAIRDFQKDGTLQVVTDAASADLVLHVKLLTFSLEPLRFERDEAKKANEYRMQINARVECENRRTGSMLVTRTVKGKATFVPAGGLSESKKTALPDAAKDLAHRIVKSIVEDW